MAMRLGARHAQMPDRSFGAVQLRKLDWDTTHFGRKMGVLTCAGFATSPRSATLGEDLALALREAAEDGYEHVILRVPGENLALAAAAEAAGMRLVDIGVDLAMNIASRQLVLAVGSNVRAACPGDLDALRAIASTAFETSRFAADPFFTAEEVANFHRQWVTNLCEGLAKTVIVAVASDEVAGFTSCAIQADGVGRIPLIATSDEYRRQGVGRALVDASLRWFASAGVSTVRVKTQASNYPALALYHRAGFTIATAELTFSAILRRGVRP